MVNVTVHHKVKDFHSWKAVFDSAFMLRKDAGEESCRLYQDIDDPNDITLWMEWESVESAEKFLKSGELARQMQLAGVDGKPHIHILQEMHMMRRTAAD